MQSKRKQFDAADSSSIPRSLMVRKKIKIMALIENFRPGDLVFGICKVIKPITEMLNKCGFTHTYAAELNDPAIGIAIEQNPDQKSLKQLDEIQYHHYAFLLRHKDYLIKIPGKPLSSKSETPQQDSAYRRACKLLLIDRSATRTSRAHVMTKEIDWHRVCNKKKSGFGITNSEMRAAYRDYKKHGKHPNIFFYDEQGDLLHQLPWEKPGIKEQFQLYEEARYLKKHSVVAAAGRRP